MESKSIDDSMKNILPSIFDDKQIPPCRYYHCYQEWNELICKSVFYRDSILIPPYTEIRCVRRNIPPCLDKWVLHIQSIPSRVYIEKE